MGVLNFDQELIHKIDKTPAAFTSFAADYGSVSPAGAMLALALCANRAPRLSALLSRGISAVRGFSAGIVFSGWPFRSGGTICQQEALAASAVYR